MKPVKIPIVKTVKEKNTSLFGKMKNTVKVNGDIVSPIWDLRNDKSPQPISDFLKKNFLKYMMNCEIILVCVRGGSLMLTRLISSKIYLKFSPIFSLQQRNFNCNQQN